jgi:SAM-dependent methyltransferase
MVGWLMPRSRDAERGDQAIRNAYAREGPQEFYRRHGATYRNPHEPILREILALALEAWRPDLSAVLDLACGSGEVTLALRERGAGVQGADPYTGGAYRARTGGEVLPLSFEHIAAGALDEQRYSLIVCAFALHLVERSRLPALCYALSQLAPALLVITPHKRPHIEASWGWSLQEELLHRRLRARLYVAGFSPETPAA